MSEITCDVCGGDGVIQVSNDLKDAVQCQTCDGNGVIEKIMARVRQEYIFTDQGYTCSLEDEMLYFDVLGPIPVIGTYIYPTGGKDKFRVIRVDYSLRDPIIGQQHIGKPIRTSAHVRLERVV